MKVLFIASEIGIEAPGIAYKKLISNLSEKCDITVFSPQIRCDLLEEKDSVYKKLPQLKKLPYYINRALFSILGEDVLGKDWAKKSVDIVLQQHKKADIIISAISSNNCETLYLGKTIAKVLGAKWVVYSVDAIPAPLGWSRNNVYYRSMKEFIRRLTKNADAFFSSNPIMLKYQKSCLDKDFKGYTGVVYTPFSQRDCKLPEKTKDPVFIYTGSLYGLRHVDTLMGAFSSFIKVYKRAKFIFVGNIDKLQFDGFNYMIEQGNLLLVGYTNDLSSYYSISTVLVDLSADIPDDVFLSSKILNYLPLNRPIVAIGGNNSTASVIFESDNSIIISTYEEHQILEALKKSVTHDYIPGESRKIFVDKFSDKAVSKRFYNDLKKIVSEV